ncbi:porin family protein [Empedobacter sedimenti]|uniref:hypothetical protein n=1 Tax=Empedobacter sedimenti TaxID=3042610 RepID=UPI0024A68A8C|nr:hypothetical protein [Empedobacter sedimenti]
MNKFDQHIKDKLSQPQIPPIDAWKGIQEKLNTDRKKRSIPLFYWIGSTAACLVVGVSILYFSQNGNDINHNSKIEVVKKSTPELPKESNRIIDSAEENQIVRVERSHSNHQHADEQTNFNFTNERRNFEDKNFFQPIFGSDSLQNNSLKQDLNSVNNKLDIAKSNSSIIENPSNNNQKLDENNSKNNELKAKIEEEKSLELVIAEQSAKREETPKIKSTTPKFAVSSFVSPSKILDSKSVLSDEFNENTINNSVTLAYGAKFSVKINDRINVRSGISKVDLEQQTQHVASGISTAIQPISTLENSPARRQNIVYNSNIQVNKASGNSATFMTFYNSTESKMSQKIQYIEVPVEIEYKLLNFDKFNLLATGGGSYYFLTKNEIEMSSQEKSQKIGKASNLNDMSYSANAGLKLEYLLSPKTSLNLEPNYRYMINSLSNVETKNPSLLGVNLGFSIKF